jgi:hypothetical protein
MSGQYGIPPRATCKASTISSVLSSKCSSQPILVSLIIHSHRGAIACKSTLMIETDPELFDVAHLPAPALAAIEADTFWCLSKLLDGIQDNYISQQPGIQRLVKRMSELVKRIDGECSLRYRAGRRDEYEWNADSSSACFALRRTGS